MPLTTSSPSQFVTTLQNGISSAYNTGRSLAALPPVTLNFTSGSILGAITTSIAAVATFLQQQAQYIVSIARAGTSSGPDLVSFVSDYFLSPPQQAATFAQSIGNQVQFGRYATSTQNQTLAVGTIVQTGSTTKPIQYQVIAPNPSDTTAATYTAGVGYVLTAGQTSLYATVQALVKGSASNVLQASTPITVISTPGVPFDFVTQVSDITNGIDAESDSGIRSRFQTYMTGNSGGNSAGVLTAVLAVQPGLTATVNSNLNGAGNAQTSYYTVVVDDGSGAIPAGTITTIQSAVNNAGPLGISFTVQAPTNQTITISVTGTTAQPGFILASVRNAVQAALIALVNAQGVGASKSATLGKVTYLSVLQTVGSFIGTGPLQGLVGYSSITVNGGTADIAITNYQLPRASAGSVTVA